MAVEAVLFDLDGTLADTAPDLGAALNRLRLAAELPALPLDAIRPHTSNGARGLLRIGFDIGPEDDRYEDLNARFLMFYAEDVCRHTRLFEGMSELVAGLEARGMPWGIVTNKAGRFTGPLLGLLNLAHRAACVVSGDTTPHAKPHPAPLLHAASLIGRQPSSCLYVGDDLRDVQAARAAGMGVLAAAYGYLGTQGDPADWHADAVIRHPLEVLNYL